MPCGDGNRVVTEEELRASLGYSWGDLEDAFCSVCTKMEELGIDLPTGAKSVWLAHEKNDKARIARETADKQRADLQAAGLAKLSPAERDALSLRG